MEAQDPSQASGTKGTLRGDRNGRAAQVTARVGAPGDREPVSCLPRPSYRRALLGRSKSHQQPEAWELMDLLLQVRRRNLPAAPQLWGPDLNEGNTRPQDLDSLRVEPCSASQVSSPLSPSLANRA